MEIIKPRTLSGFMELLPAKQIRFEKMTEILRNTYASYGFAPLDTPVIEDAQILLAKGGGETEKQIYRFTKGDSDLALRFDLTVPLAKYVALHYNDLAFPFRRFQISKVYRGERAQRGRFREFYQADIDIIGDGKLDILNEAEIPAIIYKVFKGFGLNRFQIRVNNRKILTGFYASLGLSEQSGDIMRTVDKLEKIGPDKVSAILVDELGLTAEQAKSILDFIILIIYASTYGKGALFSAIPVAILQGGVTICAGLLAPFFSPEVIANLSFLGNMMIFCVGCNLAFQAKFRVANMLPALVFGALGVTFL